MAENDIEVRFGASTDGAIAGIDQVKGELEGLSAPIAKLQELGAAAAAAFGVSQLTAFIDKFTEIGEQIERTGAMLGASTTQVQELGYIAKQTGTDEQGLAMAMERLQLNLQRAQNPTSQQALALKSLGLSARDLIGIPLPEQLARIADAVARFGDGGNKTAIIMSLMGRTGAQMIPVLDQGRAGITAMGEAADRSAVMTRATVEELANMHREAAALGSAVSALAGTLVAQLGGAFKSLGDSITQIIGNFNALISTGNLWNEELEGMRYAVDSVVTSMGNWLSALGHLSKFDFKGIMQDWGNETKAQEALLDDHVKRLATITAEAKRQMDAALAPPANQGKPQAPALAIPNTDAIKSAMDQYQTQIKLADEAFSATKAHLDAEVKLHELSNDQETAQLLTALDQRRAAEEAAIDGELRQNERGTAGYQKALDERRQLDAKYFAERQKLLDTAAERDAKVWKSAADQISGAFNSQLRSLLAGTETFSQAMKKISGDIILKFLGDQIKLTVEWLANQARILAGHIATEAGMTAATASGNAARTASNIASGQSSIIEAIANALRAIGASAGQTSAEVTAAVAPAVGPAAPAVGAAAGASVMSIAQGFVSSFDIGTDYVMRSGVAMIHRGEQIVPSAEGSGPYTGARGGGADSGLIKGLLDSHAATMGSLVAANRRSLGGLEDEFRQLHRTLRRGVR